MNRIQHSSLFIGGGNMAHAIISGAIKSSIINDHQLAVVDPDESKEAIYPNWFESAEAGMNWLIQQNAPTAIVIAVKPQMLQDALQPLYSLVGSLDHAPVFLSILAGVPLKLIESTLTQNTDLDRARVVRVMPNTPAQIGMGMSAIAANQHCTCKDKEYVEQLFQSIGQTINIKDDMMDAFTALAGSGPAYLYYLAENLIKAAEHIGFDIQEARDIVSQTVLGSAMLCDQSDEMPDQLRARVTSKKGTTYAATQRLDALGVNQAFVEAVIAARDRGQELALEISSSKDP